MKSPSFILCLILTVSVVEAGKSDSRKPRKSNPSQPRVPVLFNDALDDPIFSDVQTSFRGGQVSNKAARDLQPDEAAELVNCDLTQEGNAVARRGTVQLGGAVGPGAVGGLGYYDTQANQYLVASTLTAPHYYDGAAWAVLGAGGPANAGRTVRFAQGRAVIGGTGYDVLFLVDGSLNLWGWNGTAWTDFGTAAANQPPTAARYIAWHTNRLCLAGMNAERDAIYFSQFLEGQLWDKATWQLRVGAGEDDRISGLVSWTDFNLAVFKRRSIWVVNTNPTAAVADFEIKNVHRRIGCPNGDTAVQVGSDILFLSESGVRSLKRTIATESQSEVGEALSAPVQDIIDRINWTHIATASATYWNNRYILSIPLDSAPTMYCLVYNTLTDTWSGTWTGWNARRFSYRQVNNDPPRMCFVKSNSSVWEWLDYLRHEEEAADSYFDGSDTYVSSVRTRAFDFREPLSPKTGLNVEVDIYDTPAGLSMAYRKDGEVADTVFAAGAGGTNAYGAAPADGRERADLMAYGPFRELQISLSATGKMGVRRVTVNGFIDTMRLQ